MVKCNVYICPKVVLDFKKLVNSSFDKTSGFSAIKSWEGLPAKKMLEGGHDQNFRIKFLGS